MHGKQPVLFARNEVDRNVTEIDVVLEQIKNPPTACIRQFYIQCDCNGVILVDQVEDITKIGSHHDPQIHFMCFLDHDLSKPHIIFHHEHYLVAGNDIIAVISHFVDDLIQHI